MSRAITLTTDFGLTDEYVGVMKGVILGRAPRAMVVDLTHGIGHQNIRQAAYIVHAAYRHFPVGTVHVVVVDPGVGSTRRIVLLATEKHLFLAPDNGVLTLLLEDKTAKAYEVGCAHLYKQPLSTTFHGRDIFAPVAAALANGMQPEETGNMLPISELTALRLPQVAIDSGRQTIQGSVVVIDHFGNLMTNIHRDAFTRLFAATETVRISIKHQAIHGLATSYSATPAGALLALFGSRGYLEIAINGGNAAEQLDFSMGDIVWITHDI